MKTDLNLLLECLKYQMDQPTSQKEVLVTIYSVCHQNSDASDYFREIGGLMFVNHLVKSSVHSIVKESALYTLGGLAENNVFCQEILCTSGLFEDLCMFLSQKNSSVNLKRMSVYVLLVLVSNNKNGQTYVRESGCLDVLLQLFRTTLSISEMNLSDNAINQSYQLWSSVCSALSACVNNPQNEDNQKSCSLVFPYAKDCLQCCTKPEIVRPICSFIGLTVANNSRLQQFFVSIGGLTMLDVLLAKLIYNSSGNSSSTKLAVVVTKTLDACIADNYAVGAAVARYNIVPNLLTLLSYNMMNSGEKFSIILTLGHCTDGCEENQYALVKNNGLPLMIQALTESQDEELNKAATFVLQNCKRITEKLSVKLSEDSSNTDAAGHLEEDLQHREGIIEDYRVKAKQILDRIEQLENEHQEEKVRRQIFTDGYNNISPEDVMQTTSKHLQVNASGQSSCRGMRCTKINQPRLNLASDQLIVPTLLYHIWTVTVRELHSECLFKQPGFVVKSVRRQVPNTEPFKLRSSTTSAETSRILTTMDSKVSELRCSGRVLDSRNFCKILQSCQHLCDQHKVILHTEMKYKRNLKRSLISRTDSSMDYNESHRPESCRHCARFSTQMQKNRAARLNRPLLLPQQWRRDHRHRQLQHRDLSLMPTANTEASGIDGAIFRYHANQQEGQADLQAKHDPLAEEQTNQQKCNLGESHTYSLDEGLGESHTYSLDEDENTEIRLPDVPATAFKRSKRRTRKDFTSEEINYLLDGVQKRGHHWNTILWAYPFQKGRTNVDLAKKYCKLQEQ
ncbi:PREDICTED: telomere repeats-binding bouquet formation protein 1 [Gekko japonicus]|uniref:Telomere repeats-binding bouquet formation protein 1 n=1 Tax=Gekko japonicus TaxID=146911 RepID=A0ABM1L1B3_GEKJA|nr:PREDICTED: telomere repeats-binding bouquet formation protein 1 [Gekko japonicus]